MTNTNTHINKLFLIRNQYGREVALKKMQFLHQINISTLKTKTAATQLYSSLLFLQAYPDNEKIRQAAADLLLRLQQHVEQNENLQYKLYNSGITGSTVCAAFSFEMTKWLRETRPAEISFRSFEAGDAQVQSILSVVMTKTESEIMQDANAEWKGWLRNVRQPGETLLDQLIGIFNAGDMRPEIKDELWNTLGVNVEIRLASHCCLPSPLVKPYYHRSLTKVVKKQEGSFIYRKVKLSVKEARNIIDCSRMILLRKLRELDPISFSSPTHVSYYQLGRGLSIALTGMVANRRRPIESYMGYLVFKNGLPVAYAGSWILFDSARIGLNVFADYRGGEAKYIFQQVLLLHSKVYGLDRFTVDPYQVGKENSEGILSGAFWIYYQAGFRPLLKIQQDLALAEEVKIRLGKGYRSPATILKKLAGSRMELILKPNAVRFDAMELSLLYAAILAKNYNGNRTLMEKDLVSKMASMLGIKNYQEANTHFILKSWAVLLLTQEKFPLNRGLRKTLKKLVELKATGSEEAYISALQKAGDIKKLMEGLLKNYVAV